MVEAKESRREMDNKNTLLEKVTPENVFEGTTHTLTNFGSELQALRMYFLTLEKDAVNPKMSPGCRIGIERELQQRAKSFGLPTAQNEWRPVFEKFNAILVKDAQEIRHFVGRGDMFSAEQEVFSHDDLLTTDKELLQ